MLEVPQPEYFPGGFVTQDDLEFLALGKRKYHEVADDSRLAKRWSKARVAEEIRKLPGFEDAKNEQVYEWFEGKTDPRTSFTKAMEWVLGINLPPQCYLNAGKR